MMLALVNIFSSFRYRTHGVKEMDYSVVVPLYNEEEVINECYTRLTETMSGCDGSYELIFVNDGSDDGTMSLAREIARKDDHVKILSFSRNFGHQNAITAGMNKASGHAVIVIDADLQDPPHVIPDMIAKWKEGFEVVYGKRIKRKGESIFKKASAKLFYRALNSLTELNVPADAGDFRLLDRKVVDVLTSLPERNRYVRGLVSWVGFRQTAVEYIREERFAGKTKYPLRKMLKFASDALTSFSYKPLKLPGVAGVILSLLSFVYLLVMLLLAAFTDYELSLLACLVTVSLFFNGIVLIALNIIGQYVGRISDETKARPLYIIGETVGFETMESGNPSGEG